MYKNFNNLIFIVNLSNSFCSDQNKKNINIEVIYNNITYKAENIEITKDEFLEPNKRLNFIKTNTDKFKNGDNVLILSEYIKESDNYGKWYGYESTDNKKISLNSDQMKEHFDDLTDATIKIQDYIVIEYIKSDKPMAYMNLEDKIISYINDNVNNRKLPEIDKNSFIENIKNFIQDKCEIEIDNDIFVLNKDDNETDKIKGKVSLKINFPDEFISEETEEVSDSDDNTEEKSEGCSYKKKKLVKKKRN